MRCNECNYPLWNTPAGNCPECGTVFKPSTHAFAVGEVRFRCPDCNQDYFGDDLDGHLRPSEFECISCGRQLHEDDCLLFPADGDMEAVAELRMPLLDTSKGRFKKWIGTIGWSMTQPGRLMESVPSGTGIGLGAKFALITMAVVMLFGYLPFILMTTLPVILGGGGIGAMGFVAMGPAVTVPLALIVIIVLQIVFAHGLLLVSGSKAHGLARTGLAVLLSTGPFIIMAVPCVGSCMSPIAVVWWIISGSVMLMVGQNVSGVRAAFSMLILPLLVVGGYVAFMVAMMLLSFNAITPLPAATAAWADTGLAPVINELYVDSGELPTVKELVANDPDAEDQLVGELFKFETAEASGWASGSIFVSTFTAENPEVVALKLAVLEWDEEAQELTYSLWSGPNLTKRSIPSNSIKEAVEDLQVEMVGTAGLSGIAFRYLQSEDLGKWVERYMAK